MMNGYYRCKLKVTFYEDYKDGMSFAMFDSDVGNCVVMDDKCYINRFVVEIFDHDCPGVDMFATFSNHVDKDSIFVVTGKSVKDLWNKLWRHAFDNDNYDTGSGKYTTKGEAVKDLLGDILDYLDAVEDDVKKLGV